MDATLGKPKLTYFHVKQDILRVRCVINAPQLMNEDFWCVNASKMLAFKGPKVGCGHGCNPWTKS